MFSCPWFNTDHRTLWIIGRPINKSSTAEGHHHLNLSSQACPRKMHLGEVAIGCTLNKGVKACFQSFRSEWPAHETSCACLLVLACCFGFTLVSFLEDAELHRRAQDLLGLHHLPVLLIVKPFASVGDQSQASPLVRSAVAASE